MERKIIARGVLAGLVAGLLAFVFARILAEPVIQSAIDYESGRDDAQSAIDKALGLPVEPGSPEIFSRTVQANLGMGAGMVLFGAAMGAVFAVVFAVCLGRVGRIRPRTLAVLVAGAGFLAVYLVPFVKYPANPPSIGRGETIRDRGFLYLTMLLSSVVLLSLAVWLGQRLAPRSGTWNATLLAGLGYVVAVGIVMAILPPLGHLADNVQHYGKFATETPQPLRAPDGTIAYPGFPADLLYRFRLYSIGAQLILWSAIGLVFAPMAERLLARSRTGSSCPSRPTTW